MNRLEKKFQRNNLALGLVLAALVGIAGPLVAAAAVSNPVAILDSARTKTYFRLHYGYCVADSADPNAVGEMEYKRYWGGWEEVLKELQKAGTIPGYDIVTDGACLL